MRTLAIFLTLVCMMTACSTFKSSRRLDMSPFADNSGTLFNEANKVSHMFQWKNLKPYITIPELQELLSHGKPLLDAFNGIVYYSNQVVAINNSSLSEPEKNQQLARYLQEAMEKALEKQKIDSLQLDAARAGFVLENVRNAKTYLDGVAAAGPVINTVVLAIQSRLDQIQNHIPDILNGFQREIDRDYAPTKKNYLRLLNLQEQIMLSVTRLYRARIGDRAELDTLLQQDASMRNFFVSADKTSPAQLAAAEAYLLDQLHQINIMMQQLDETKADYIAKQDELITWRLQLDEKIRIARNAITVWAQSHRNLGAGIPVPPLIDVAGIATGMMGSAAKTILP